MQTVFRMQNPYLSQATKSKEDLVLENVTSVKFIAKKLSARLPPTIDVEDLIQSGMIGLMEAAEKFDPSKEVKFKTFAELRIRGAMLDDLRSKDWIPRSVRENSGKLEKAYVEIRAKGIDNPTDNQLAKHMGMKLSEFYDFLSHARPIPLLSIEALNGIDHEETLNILDVIPDPDAEDQVITLVGKEKKQELMEALQKLPEKEQLVLSLYYNEEMNLKEIGAVLDITESRVSQLRTKAIAMLRSLMSD